MRTVPLLFVGLAFVLLLTDCSYGGPRQETVDESPVAVAPNGYVTKQIAVEGMTCTSCAWGIELQMRTIEGVYTASLDYDTAIGQVTYDPEKVSQEALVKSADPFVLNLLN